MLAVLFICVCSGVSEAEVQSEELLQEAQTTTTVVTIEVEEVEEPAEADFEAGSFEYYCYIIEQAAESQSVDPALAIAIARLETGNFTSGAFVSGHNFGGLTGSTGVMSFSSEEAGLDAYIACLSWYASQGMTTAREMASVYCPPSTDWAAQVEEIMREVVAWQTTRTT